MNMVSIQMADSDINYYEGQEGVQHMHSFQVQFWQVNIHFLIYLDYYCMIL